MSSWVSALPFKFKCRIRFWQKPALLGLVLIAAVARAQPCDRLLSPSGARAERVDRLVKTDLPAIEALFQQIVKKYPIATSEFVLIGRSPSLLAAYLDAQSAYFSELRSWVLPVSLKARSEVSSDRLRERFTRLFNAFRSPLSETSRRLVFIDFTHEGRTFLALERLLAQLDMHADFVGFSHDPEGVRSRWNKLHHVFNLQTFEISFDLESRLAEHKALAPYDSYRIEEKDYGGLRGADPKILRPEYIMAREQIRLDLQR